jgi:hypothetical protein
LIAVVVRTVLSGSTLKLADCNEITFPDRTNVISANRHQCLRATGGENEFNLKVVGFMDLHHSSKISATKPMLGQVVFENYGVEYLEHWHYLGKAVMKRGKSSLASTIQTAVTFAVRPDGPRMVP